VRYGRSQVCLGSMHTVLEYSFSHLYVLKNGWVYCIERPLRRIQVGATLRSSLAYNINYMKKLWLPIWAKLNSLAWVSEQTILTERPPLVGEVGANFCRQTVPRGQHNGSLQPYSRFSRPEPLLFLPSSSPIILTKLSGPRSRPTTSQKNLVVPGIEPGPLDL
jgi:hypothetical protein